jgi:LmbE family N-acetylglucosaminyl deacetylase
VLSLPLPIPDGRPLQLLCIGAHCDDIEIGCGGTVLRTVAELPRVEVHWVVLTSNEEREFEARASASAFLAGAEHACIEVRTFRESYLPYVGAEVKDYFEVLKRSVHPDLIFTHHREDRHQDHRLVSDLTWSTFRDAFILEYEIPKWDGDLGTPNLFVPLSAEVAGEKIDLAVEHFASQRSRPWFDAETFTALMRLRGMECNAPERRAEAFYARKLALFA